MASLTRSTWVCGDSGNWWWTGIMTCCRTWGCKSWTRLRDWTELNSNVEVSTFLHANRVILVCLHDLSHFFFHFMKIWKLFFLCEIRACLYHKYSWEELSDVRDQGQKLGGHHAQRAAAKELPNVRGQEQQPGGATVHPRSVAAAEGSHSWSETRGRGQEEPPHIRVQGLWPGGATPHPRSGQYGFSMVWSAVAALAQEGLEESSNVEGQEGWWWEDTPQSR